MKQRLSEEEAQAHMGSVADLVVQQTVRAEKLAAAAAKEEADAAAAQAAAQKKKGKKGSGDGSGGGGMLPTFRGVRKAAASVKRGIFGSKASKNGAANAKGGRDSLSAEAATTQTSAAEESAGAVAQDKPHPPSLYPGDLAGASEKETGATGEGDDSGVTNSSSRHRGGSRSTQLVSQSADAAVAAQAAGYEYYEKQQTQEQEQLEQEKQEKQELEQHQVKDGDATVAAAVPIAVAEAVVWTEAVAVTSNSSSAPPRTLEPIRAPPLPARPSLGHVANNSNNAFGGSGGGGGIASAGNLDSADQGSADQGSAGRRSSSSAGASANVESSGSIAAAADDAGEVAAKPKKIPPLLPPRPSTSAAGQPQQPEPAAASSSTIGVAARGGASAAGDGTSGQANRGTPPPLPARKPGIGARE